MRGVIPFTNTFAEQLPELGVRSTPSGAPAPSVVQFNESLARELGLAPEFLRSVDGLAVLAGNQVPKGAVPIAQAYAGHQFGGFSPQLGDGRALLLGELVDAQGVRRDMAFKGSGKTVFSRGGDGKATLGPMLREHLLGEAMHALSIPSTRVLAVVATGEHVAREGMLPGALIVRVAASHIRVGSFEFVAARGDFELLRRLADFVIERHYVHLAGTPGCYLALLSAVIERQASLIAKWMNVGFVHGVMNTDNMTLSGETIDYGPCAFLEAYSPSAVFSSIDRNGRYAFGQQPKIAKWNLARLADTLLPLIAAQNEGDDERAVALATEALGAFDGVYEAHWMQGACAKLGLAEKHEGDVELVRDWLSLLSTHNVDFTRAHRALVPAAAGDTTELMSLLGSHEQSCAWLARWHTRIAPQGTTPAAQKRMRAINPVYIPRNHLVEQALAAAVQHGDLQPYEALLAAVTQPFSGGPEMQALAEPAPAEFTANYRTFCGT